MAKVFGLLLAILLAIVMALLLPVTGSSYYSEALVILSVTFLFLSLPVIIALLKNRFDPFEPIYLWIAVYGYLFVIKPLGKIVSGGSFPFAGDESILTKAFLLALLGLLVFYLGYYNRLGRIIASRIPMIGASFFWKRLRRCAWIFLLAGSVAFWVYIEISGGWVQYFSLPHGYGGRSDLTTAYIYMLRDLVIVGFFILFLDGLRRGKISHMAVIILITIWPAFIYGVASGSRGITFWMIVTCFVLYYLNKGKRPSLPVMGGLLGLLAIIVILLPAYRSFWHLGGDIPAMLEVSPVGVVKEELSGGSEGDEFSVYLAVLTWVPEYVDYGYFKIYSRIPLHPIPRLLWPDKPELFNPGWDDLLFRSGIGVGSAETVLGDFYQQLGIIGIIVGMFLSGVLWKAIYSYLRRAPTNEGVQLIYAVTLPLVLPFVAQAPWSAFWKWLPFMGPGVIIAFLYARTRRGH